MRRMTPVSLTLCGSHNILIIRFRWGSIIHCLQSVCINKHALQALAINDDAKTALDPSVRKLLLSEIFWDRAEGLLKLLKPVADAITKVEGDDKHLSIVMKVLSELQQSFEENLSSSPILKSEEETFKKIIPERKKFLVKSIHLAANLIDPRYRGCHISGEEAVRSSLFFSGRSAFALTLVMINSLILKPIEICI